MQHFNAPPPTFRYVPMKRQLLVKVWIWSSRSTIMTTKNTIAHTTVTSFDVIDLRRGRSNGIRSTTP